MKTLLDAAMLLRKSIKKCKKWEFIGSLENVSDEYTHGTLQLLPVGDTRPNQLTISREEVD